MKQKTIKENLYKLNKIHYNLVKKNWWLKQLGSIFTVGLFTFFFIFFLQFPIELEWPSIGDPPAHGMYTALSLYQGHIPFTMDPIKPYPTNYPTGFHVFAASLSLLLGFEPGEIIFIIATFSITLVALLLFSLTFVLTRSYLFSIPIPFTVFIMHQSGHLEVYLSGFLFNGVFPNTVGFMMIFGLINILQIFYQHGKSTQKILPIVLIILISLLFVYPSYIIHAFVFTILYFGSTLSKNTFISFWNDKIKIISLRLTRINFSNFKNTLFTINNSSSLFEKILVNKHNIISFTILLTLFLAMTVGSIFGYYQEIIGYGTNYYSENIYRFNISTALDTFFEDKLFWIIVLLGVVSSFIIFFVKLKPLPIVLGYLVFLGILIFDLIYLLPNRTLVILMTLAWIIIAFTIHEITRGKTKNNYVKNYLTVFIFIVIILIISLPNINTISDRAPGWFLTNTTAVTNFQSNYDTSLWLRENVDTDELVLIDKSWSSLFLYSFSVFNLSHSQWNTHLEPMRVELDEIWNHPEDKILVKNLLTKYGVDYIVLMDEWGYRNDKRWGGVNDNYLQKPYKNHEYEKFFLDYDFIELAYKNGNSIVFKIDTL